MSWMASWLLLASLPVPLPAPPVGGGQPNVLLVVLDDIGVDKISAYAEHPQPATTEAIDFLASRGVLFRNAWSHDTCSPTRAGILTGRQPAHHGIGTFIGTPEDVVDLSPDVVSLADVLAAAGYRTAAIGKWHLSAAFAPTDLHLHPLLLGFEHHSGPISNFPEIDGAGAYYAFDKSVDGSIQPETTYATTSQVDDALAIIDQFEQEGDEPWFVWLAFNAPHKPYHLPPPELHDEQLHEQVPFDRSGVAGGPSSGTTGSGPAGGAPGPANPAPGPGPTSAHETPPLDRRVPKDPALHGPAYMRAATEALDAELSRLLASLPPGTLGETVVVVLGDNGTERSAVEAPFDPEHAKSTLFEGGINVPLLISGPGIDEGESAALVHTSDLFATVANLGGADASAGLDSFDLTPYLLDATTADLRGWVYTERHRPNGPPPYVFREQAARDARFKLVRRFTMGTGQPPALYDLLSDPFETTDLAAPERGGLDAEAQAAFDALLIVLDDHL